MKKAILLNGSPRKNGNTAAALAAIRDGLANRYDVETISVCDLKLRGCINCDGCQKNGGNCVLNDGGREFMDKIAAAGLLIFGSPVYWWGISAQLKAALDKFYSRGEEFHRVKKSIGIVAVGEAELSDPEYKLISGQFHCIADFLGWNVVLDRSFSACAPGDLAKAPDALPQLKSDAEKL